jgi:hypothetical protein
LQQKYPISDVFKLRFKEDVLRNEMLDFGSHVPVPLKGIIETDGDQISMPDEFLEPNGVLRHKTHPWSPYQDQRLFARICHHGIENWTAISKFVDNGRTRSQRWYRGLDQTISKAPCRWRRKTDSLHWSRSSATGCGQRSHRGLAAGARSSAAINAARSRERRLRRMS